MRKVSIENHGARERRSERGAALITTLLIASLLLAAGGVLILTTGLSATTTVDAATEAQAYYGAEAGLQAALNVLRGNASPNPVFVANPLGGVADENVITFRKAYDLSTSNLAGDPTTANFPARLSRWVSYNYTSSGSAYADRVALTQGYTSYTGSAYSLSVSDPDDATRSKLASDPLYKPRRLLIESTGYGPRGARKTLAMYIAAYALDIDAPAPLVMRGHDDHTTNMNFDIGSSNAKKYSGHDFILNGEGVKPSFAVSPHDINTALAAYTCSSCKPETVIDPKMGVLDLPNEPLDPILASSYALVPTPWFLQTADNARLFLSMAQTLAQKKGKVLSSLDGYAGSTSSPQITFVNGNCNLDGGAGLLIVTGTLTMKGGPSFDGVILVLGAGKVIRNGGGDGNIHGAMMIAKFNSTGDFLAPSFDVSGGGGSDLQYDSHAIELARISLGHPVLGIVER
ncbi:MAG: hypothetical protein AUG51_02425 [Acidobacteria bacterium 13_1_20CM_3_53_8]|nr:MAG: hypothetical protein AUG51_02425 [Acidobacteria bacterium 13_1_20CM_3_53_8]